MKEKLSNFINKVKEFINNNNFLTLLLCTFIIGLCGYCCYLCPEILFYILIWAICEYVYNKLN